MGVASWQPVNTRRSMRTERSFEEARWHWQFKQLAYPSLSATYGRKSQCAATSSSLHLFHTQFNRHLLSHVLRRWSATISNECDDSKTLALYKQQIVARGCTLGFQRWQTSLSFRWWHMTTRCRRLRVMSKAGRRMLLLTIRRIARLRLRKRWQFWRGHEIGQEEIISARFALFESHRLLDQQHILKDILTRHLQFPLGSMWRRTSLRAGLFALSRTKHNSVEDSPTSVAICRGLFVKVCLRWRRRYTLCHVFHTFRLAGMHKVIEVLCHKSDNATRVLP